MTLKEMMKKIESFNEVASQIGADTARVYLYDGVTSGEWFETWTELRKAIRSEYVKEYADVVLKADTYEINGDTEIEYTSKLGTHKQLTLSTAVETRRYW